ncbi:uncharacterized protein LOC121729152 [Aricia agestis]|uniref:uncharacterized protein LOC121729152 n=1 Tax=Aricia agestis TaxID=91739 RepID=UPI001C207B35|nr:uncharacterized protein LOC121729152 [Aricia agestis]
MNTRSAHAKQASSSAVLESSVDGTPTPPPVSADTSPCAAGADAAQVPAEDPQPAGGAAAAPVTMTTDQLLLLIDRLSRGEPVSTLPISTGNFAKCTARFNGENNSNVEAFIDAVETYKECLRIDDHNALRGLSMLLTGLAATWWQGVKDTTLSWQAALEALKQTFGPRLPPHKLYRKIFEREQRVDESTDLFICHVRALFAQLPQFTLTETVQLDMAYGLMHRRIREKVPRANFTSFAELLAQARRGEDIIDESRPRVNMDTKPAPYTSATAQAEPIITTRKFRPQCKYCKQYGHLKEDCQRIAKQAKTRDGPVEGASRSPAVTCFGCGTPGVIRSNCPTCKEKKSSAPPVPSKSTFQSVSASCANIDSRVRPVLRVQICGEFGNLIVDTGAKHSVGSVSLRAHLFKHGCQFQNVFTELKYADGRTSAQNVEIAHVNVTVRGVARAVDFIMLPDATESLLGMNFIEDIGMVLDFDRGVWYVRHDRSPESIIFETKPLRPLTCSSVGLRDDEGSHLCLDERERLSDLLNIHEDIFTPGGGPSDFAVHRIDTGDAAPIASPPYRPDPTKVVAVMNMKPPTNLKELKTFLQTCSWFRKFIPQFSDLARPLTELTKKDRRWMWGEDQQRAFDELKVRLSNSPILRQASFDEPFVLRTDASAYALGAVLLQGPSHHEERPIEYASRLLTAAERNYHTTEREALAVVWALDKFRGYLEGAQVHVATDHQPLRWLLSLKTPSGRLARWAMKIQSFDLQINYTPGRVNLVADTLSRPVTNLAEEAITGSCGICPVVVDLPQCSPEDIRKAQLNDSEVSKVIEDFENSDDPAAAVRWTDRGYYIERGVLYRCDPDGVSEEPQLVVPESLKAEIMKELHDAPTAGHLGLERTLRKIKEKYYFRNMRTYVAQYLKSCDLCQKYKATNLKPAGLLQTPVLQQRFEVLAMDLFGPLPEAEGGEKWVFLIEDTASRWIELFALCDATAESCAKVLIEEVFLRYGLPRRVISDNGSQFVSAVMQKAMFVLGVQQALIPVYHPEANPAERKNRELKQLLGILVGPEHRQWPTVLPKVRFALNSAYNQGTGQTAAYLTFAREMRSPITVHTDLRDIVSQQNFVPQITPYLKEFARILLDVKHRVEEQQDLRKASGDSKRRESPSFAEGDLVLVDAHLMSNAAKGFTSKFAPKREGPYRVAQLVSPTSFIVEDANGVVRGKYHASALTPYVGPSTVVVHQRRRGRPAKSQTGRACDLEGEAIARSTKQAPRATPRTASPGPIIPLRRSGRDRRPITRSEYEYYLRAHV